MCPMVKKPFGIELALLGLLQPGPEHGYALYRRLRERTGLGRIWRVKQSQLYALLERLEEAGYVASQVKSQSQVPVRRIYRLTPAGAEAYRDWLRTPVQRPNQVRQELLAKLFFVRETDSGERRALLAEQDQMCRRWKAALESERATLDAPGSFDELVLKFRLAQVEMIQSFLKEIT